MPHSTPQAPRCFAAPAAIDDVAGDAPEIAKGTDAGQLHDTFEAWSHWSRTRRFYGPPPKTGTILGRISGKPRPYAGGVPDIECRPDLAALHLAILAQPNDALDTQVFYAYYGLRCKNIKQVASILDISRTHFYRLLKSFCERTHAASLVIAAHNQAQRDALPHYAGKPQGDDHE